MENLISILIVEDNRLDGIITERVLQKDGIFKIQIAVNLANAINILDNDQIEAVVLDLNLPDSQGIETFFSIRNKNYKLPIIVLSGNENRQLTSEILKNGGQEVINKGKIARQSVTEAILNSIERNKFVLENKEIAIL